MDALGHMQKMQSLVKIKLFEAPRRQIASNTSLKILSIPCGPEIRSDCWQIYDSAFQREHDIEEIGEESSGLPSFNNLPTSAPRRQQICVSSSRELPIQRSKTLLMMAMTTREGALAIL